MASAVTSGLDSSSNTAARDGQRGQWRPGRRGDQRQPGGPARHLSSSVAQLVEHGQAGQHGAQRIERGERGGQGDTAKDGAQLVGSRDLAFYESSVSRF